MNHSIQELEMGLAELEATHRRRLSLESMISEITQTGTVSQEQFRRISSYAPDKIKLSYSPERFQRLDDEARVYIALENLERFRGLLIGGALALVIGLFLKFFGGSGSSGGGGGGGGGGGSHGLAEVKKTVEESIQVVEATAVVIEDKVKPLLLEHKAPLLLEHKPQAGTQSPQEHSLQSRVQQMLRAWHVDEHRVQSVTSDPIKFMHYLADSESGYVLDVFRAAFRSCFYAIIFDPADSHKRSALATATKAISGNIAQRLEKCIGYAEYAESILRGHGEVLLDPREAVHYVDMDKDLQAIREMVRIQDRYAVPDADEAEIVDSFGMLVRKFLEKADWKDVSRLLPNIATGHKSLDGLAELADNVNLFATSITRDGEKRLEKLSQISHEYAIAISRLPPTDHQQRHRLTTIRSGVEKMDSIAATIGKSMAHVLKMVLDINTACGRLGRMSKHADAFIDKIVEQTIAASESPATEAYADTLDEELMLAERREKRLNTLVTAIRETGYMTQDHYVALESLQPGILSEHISLESFVALPVDERIGFALENAAVIKKFLIGGGIALVISWIISKLFGGGGGSGSGGGGGGSAAAGAQKAPSITDAAAAMDNLKREMSVHYKAIKELDANKHFGVEASKDLAEYWEKNQIPKSIRIPKNPGELLAFVDSEAFKALCERHVELEWICPAFFGAPSPDSSSITGQVLVDFAKAVAMSSDARWAHIHAKVLSFSAKLDSLENDGTALTHTADTSSQKLADYVFMDRWMRANTKSFYVDHSVCSEFQRAVKGAMAETVTADWFYDNEIKRKTVAMMVDNIGVSTKTWLKLIEEDSTFWTNDHGMAKRLEQISERLRGFYEQHKGESRNAIQAMLNEIKDEEALFKCVSSVMSGFTLKFNSLVKRLHLKDNSKDMIDRAVVAVGTHHLSVLSSISRTSD